MIKTLAAFALLSSFAPAFATEETITINVDRVCSNLVGVPYATDSLSDAKWQEFTNCRNYLRSYSESR